jgi:hypothetical protein
MKIKSSFTLIVNGDADDIGRQQIRGKLEAFEIRVDRESQCFSQGGFPVPGASSSRMCPPVTRQASSFRMALCCPFITVSMLVISRL